MQRQLYEDLLQSLEGYANVKAERISIHEAWNKSPPTESDGTEFYDYMKNVG